MRLYTKSLESVEEKDLRNHISYWLVMSTLLENGMIEQMEQD
jgi:hypothetical protein